LHQYIFDQERESKRKERWTGAERIWQNGKIGVKVWGRKGWKKEVRDEEKTKSEKERNTDENDWTINQPSIMVNFKTNHQHQLCFADKKTGNTEYII